MRQVSWLLIDILKPETKAKKGDKHNIPLCLSPFFLPMSKGFSMSIMGCRTVFLETLRFFKVPSWVP